MPYIEFKTNISVEKEKTEKLLKAFGEKISLIPGKSETWLMDSVQDNVPMMFSGKDDPCAIIKISIFGAAPAQSYEKLTDSICQTVHDMLGIPADRVYIRYDEIKYWGWNNSNF